MRDAEIALEGVFAREREGPVNEPDRQVELVAVGETERRAGLAGDAVARGVCARAELVAELRQAVHPQRAVTRPPAVVEGAARGSDRSVHVGGVRIRGPADRFARRRADVVVAAAAARGSQPTVDEELRARVIAHRRAQVRIH